MSDIYVENQSGFFSVFAKTSLKKDQIIYSLPQEPASLTPSRTSIRVQNLHVEDNVGRYINHSCQPSCKIDGFNIVALKDLQPNDEITFDYTTNEKSPLANPFTCLNCGQLITGHPPPCRQSVS